MTNRPSRHRLPRLALVALAAAILAACSGGGEAPQASGQQSADARPQTATPAPGTQAPAVDLDSMTYQEIVDHFIQAPVEDEFNPDVTDANRDARTPARGGILRVRSSADLAGLNPLTAKGQPEIDFIKNMMDTMVRRNPVTLEYLPQLAWSYSSADSIMMQGGESVQGILVVKGDEADPSSPVVFVPGARRHTFNKFDVAAADGDGLTLTGAHGGRTIRGTVEEGIAITTVDTSTDPGLAAGTIETTVGELATWRDTAAAGGPRDRPYMKPMSSFIFHLRDGVRWHDGEPFTAEDVKFSFESVLNPDVDASLLRSLIEPYLSDIEVLDGGLAIEFTAHKPFWNLFGSIGQMYLVPRHVFRPEQFGGDSKAFADAFNRHPIREGYIGTGPFKFKNWRKGQDVRAERNPDYWASKLPEGAVPGWHPDQPYVDEIVLVIIQDNYVALKEIMRGGIDVDPGVEPSIWYHNDTRNPEFDRNVVKAECLGLLFTYIGWNNARSKFDSDTRKALSHLVPRQRIIDDIHRGLAVPVSGPFYLHSPGYDPTVPNIEYNPQLAGRMLRQAGWLDRDGDGIIEKEINGQLVPFEFEYLIHSAKDYHQKVADIVKESVEQAGIRVNIRKLDWTVYAEQVRGKNFDAVRYAWGAAIDPDPYPIFHSSQSREDGGNFLSYSNPRVDEICEQMREEFDPLKRWAMARELHRLIAEDSPMTFMFAFSNQYFYNRGLQGVKLYPDSYPHDFTEWWWADAARRGE